MGGFSALRFAIAFPLRLGRVPARAGDLIFFGEAVPLVGYLEVPVRMCRDLQIES